jgi:ComF family protein
MMGEAMLLASSPQRPLPDWIDPVPLHASRFRKRGYNQAGQLALGIAEALQKPSIEAVLLRPNYTESQTTKNREQRLKAMQQVFEVETNPDLAGKHVLLVDDVLTTGATLGACGEALLKAGAAYVSIAILAVAD